MNDNNYIYMQIKNYLQDLIEVNKKIKKFKLPSETDLAIKFKTTRVSVKKAITILENEKKIYCIKGKGSFINNMEIANNSLIKKKKLVAILTPVLFSNHINYILKSLLIKLEDVNIFPILVYTNSSQKIEEKKIIELLEQGISALIIYPVDNDVYNPQIVNLLLNKFPIIFIDRNLPGIQVNFVTSKNFKAVYNATEFLINKGKKNISIILNAHSAKLYTIKERLNGFTTAMKDNNIYIPPNFIFDSSNDDYQKIKLYLIEHILNKKDINAIISISYVASLHLLRIIKELKIKVPDDIELIIYDNIYESSFKSLDFDFYYIEQDQDKIGEITANLLISLLENPFQKEQIIQVPTKFLNTASIDNILLSKKHYS